jgi:hypothetical protein
MKSCVTLSSRPTSVSSFVTLKKLLTAHGRLFTELSLHGIQDKIKPRFKWYLNSRNQRADINITSTPNWALVKIYISSGYSSWFPHFSHVHDMTSKCQFSSKLILWADYIDIIFSSIQRHATCKIALIVLQ